MSNRIRDIAMYGSIGDYVSDPYLFLNSYIGTSVEYYSHFIIIHAVAGYFSFIIIHAVAGYFHSS